MASHPFSSSLQLESGLVWLLLLHQNVTISEGIAYALMKDSVTHTRVRDTNNCVEDFHYVNRLIILKVCKVLSQLVFLVSQPISFSVH